MKFKKLLCMVLAVAMVGSMLAGCSSSNDKSDAQEVAQSFTPGVYTGTGQGKNGDIVVDVTFSEDKITAIEVKSSNETESLAKPVFEQVLAQVLDKQSVSVDAVAGATLTSNGFIEAVSDAIVQAGGNPNAGASSSSNTEASTKVEELETDVVVIGSGASGTAAALAALEGGAKVTVLEKQGVVGGTSQLAEGLFGVGSSIQKEMGEDVTEKEMFDELVDFTHGLANQKLIQAFVEKSGSTVDWLLDHGVELYVSEKNQQIAHLDDPRVYHRIEGSQAFDALYESFDKLGGTLMTSTTATEIVKDSDGNVKQVIAKKADGTTVKINCKAAIVATGGFSGSEEMLDEYGNVGYSITLGSGSVGDGLKMAWAADANKDGIIMQYHKINFPDMVIDANYSGNLSKFGEFPLLYVDPSGKRFFNEEGVFDSAISANSLASVGGDAYIIFDQQTIDRMVKNGIEVPNSFTDADFREGGLDFSDFQAEIDQYVAEGVVKKADTLEELAEILNMDAATLTETVTNYNKYVETGVDEEFYKDAKSLVYDVTTKPYYAVRAGAVVLTTLGGIEINENTEVLNSKGEVIPGLYAVGNDASGMYGDSYPTTEGVTLGFAYNSGRIAGENAAKLVTEQ